MVSAVDYMLTVNEFKLVRDVVYKHCGISLGDEKISLVRARVTRQMLCGGFRSVKAYLDHVLNDPGGGAFLMFIDSISTNLTGFFRENEHFKYLSNEYLPALLARKHRAGDGRVLAWSAACSSGEEPYTLAMTLLEAANQCSVGPARFDLRLLATDISTAMLTAARAGVYSTERVATVPPRLRDQYFSRVDGDVAKPMYEVSPQLRRIIRFRHLNLMDTWPFKGPFDFIFCRNVMIYFDKPTQEKLVDRLWNCLGPGGLLFTGHSESLMGFAYGFTNRRPSIYEKSLSCWEKPCTSS